MLPLALPHLAVTTAVDAMVGAVTFKTDTPVVLVQLLVSFMVMYKTLPPIR
jgi:hypothetical protein